MTVELRTLRVSAEMDAAKFEAGAQKVVAAEKAMAAGGKEAAAGIAAVGQAATVADTKVSTAGNALERLSRQYVDGYGSAQRAASALASLSREIEKNGYDAARTTLILEGIYRKHGQLADSAMFAARGQTELAQAIAATTTRMQQQEAAANRIVSVNDNMPMTGGNASWRRQGLMYQGFDIGTSLAGGINPAMVAVQQGPQILQMYAGQGGVNALLKDAASLAGTLVTRLGPIGVVAGAGALAISNMQEEIEKATGKAYTFGEVAKTAIGIVAGDIRSLLQPAIDAIWPPIQYAFEKLSSAAIDLGEMIINSFGAAAADVRFLWEQIPNAISGAVIGATNAIVNGTLKMTEMAAGYIDALSAKINVVLEALERVTGVGARIPMIGFDAESYPLLDNPYPGIMDAANEEHRRRQLERLGSHPIRDYFAGVGRRVGDSLGAGSGLPDGNNIPIPRFQGVDDRTWAPSIDRPDAWAGARDVDRQALRKINDEYDQWKARREEAGEVVRGFFDDFRSGLMEGKDFGEAFGDAIINAMLNAMNKATDKLVDQLVNSLLDAVLPAKYGGVGGGSAGGAATFVANTTASAFFREAGGMAMNDNYAPGAVTRAPLADVGAVVGRTRLGQDLASIRTANGLVADVNAAYAKNFQGLVGDLEASGYRIRSIGGYSHRNIAGTNTLSNHAFGNAIDINPAQNPHVRGSLVTDMDPSVASALADKWGLSWGGNWRSSKDAMHFEVPKGGTAEAAAAIQQMQQSATSASTAMEGVTEASTSVTKGFTDIGNTLSSAAGAPGSQGGGGGGGLLSLLFGGVSPFSGAVPAGFGQTSFGFRSDVVGQFHEGGIAGHATQFRSVDPRVFIGAPRYHNGGLAGDEVPAILRRGEPVFKSMAHARQVVGNDNGRSAPVININVNGARGNTEIRSMVQEGVQAGLAQYDEGQKYGRAAQTDDEYRAMKG